ncbi:hypothetical protein M9H77_36475 [Catharanthus roseus]|uniref:Uncharacterized protein n=1 Tax=Catharanthus roseus TaxID=4058 RepID=A0ACB9ZVM8_CATRO|nr:hypothetical protein M9H77_36475 [Catharanthus roseus]
MSPSKQTTTKVESLFIHEFAKELKVDSCSATGLVASQTTGVGLQHCDAGAVGNGARERREELKEKLQRGKIYSAGRAQLERELRAKPPREKTTWFATGGRRKLIGGRGIISKKRGSHRSKDCAVERLEDFCGA